MKNTNYKGRCVKKKLSKCKDVVRTYDDIQLAYADILESDENVVEIQCNVILTDLPIGEFTSDFVCILRNSRIMVRECVYRKI